MDNPVSLILDKGITFAIATVAVFLVGYFIKNENDRREKKFTEFEAKMFTWENAMMNASSTTKTTANKSIESLKLESNLIRVQMETTKEAIAEFKNQITKEVLNIRVSSSEIQQNVRETKKSFDESLGKIIIIEQNYEALKSGMQSKLNAMAQLYKNQESKISELRKIK